MTWQIPLSPTFEDLRHEYTEALKYNTELEEKNKLLVTKNLELENKVGSGTNLYTG